jgi:hypothetical protein
MLYDLAPIYERDCPEAKIIAGYLNFKTPVKEELREKMKPEEWEIYEAIEEAAQLGFKEKVLDYVKKLKSDEMRKVSETPPELVREIEDVFTNSPTDKHITPGETTGVPTSLTPEEEEEIQRVHGKEIPKILNKLKLKTETQTIVKTEAIGGINTEQFLLAEYGGHCQICNVKLYLGSKDRGKKGLVFHTTHLIERRNRKPYTEMEWNVLCLCPNHFALLKYGKKDLKGIWELANKVLNGEIAAEWVEERRGDYYIAKIKMMRESGKLEETELYYSPTHMRKIVALLKEGNEPQE